jgi:predicted SAM-dependent methyltransferase
MIFTEHFLDHLQFPHVVGRFLNECFRILEPGGRLRIIVHDAELLARAYLARDEDFFRRAMRGVPPLVQTVNAIFRFNGFHQFIYDFEAMAMVLRKAQFETVVRSSFRGSELSELNLDSDEPDREVQSLYVEAIKGRQRGIASDGR